MCIKYHGLSMLYFVAAAVNGYNFKRAFIFNYLSDTLLNIDYKKRKKVDKPTKWYYNQLYGTFFFKMKFIVHPLFGVLVFWGSHSLGSQNLGIFDLDCCVLAYFHIKWGPLCFCKSSTI